MASRIILVILRMWLKTNLCIHMDEDTKPHVTDSTRYIHPARIDKKKHSHRH